MGSLVGEVLLGLCWKAVCVMDQGCVVGIVYQLQSDFK